MMVDISKSELQFKYQNLFVLKKYVDTRLQIFLSNQNKHQHIVNIECHRPLLYAKSDVMENIFKENSKTSYDIFLPDHLNTTKNVIIRFFYLFYCETFDEDILLIIKQDFYNFYILASFFEYKHLLNVMENIAIELIDVNTIFAFYELFVTYRDKSNLLKYCIQYSKIHFKKITEQIKDPCFIFKTDNIKNLIKCISNSIETFSLNTYNSKDVKLKFAFIDKSINKHLNFNKLEFDEKKIINTKKIQYKDIELLECKYNTITISIILRYDFQESKVELLILAKENRIESKISLPIEFILITPQKSIKINKILEIDCDSIFKSIQSFSIKELDDYSFTKNYYHYNKDNYLFINNNEKIGPFISISKAKHYYFKIRLLDQIRLN